MSNRLVLSRFLNIEAPKDEAPEARVRHLIGSLETGVPDLAENHRSYLLESASSLFARSRKPQRGDGV